MYNQHAGKRMMTLEIAPTSVEGASMLDVVELAREIGFEQQAEISADAVVTDEALAQSCSPQTCRKYASCWSCPPGAGTFEERSAHFVGKDGGVLVQTVRENVDLFEEPELMGEIRDLHNTRLDRLADVLRAEYDDVLEFSTGGCDLCKPCSYPDAPCNLPDKQRLSLSAHGVAVGSTCVNAGLDYSFENGRVRYVGMILYRTRG